MGVRDSPDFDEKLAQLKYLIDQREDARIDIDQKYLTIDSILNRIDALSDSGLLDGFRVLTIGDADLTGLAIAIFGNPTESVVADIDDRLSEVYFEATLEYDLPVRYLYHDMRIKIIAILKKQYTLVLSEPPRTKEGISLFISRALEILEPGDNNKLVISIPDEEELKSHFLRELESYKIQIVKTHEGINQYIDDYSPSSMYELSVPNDVVPKLKDHHIDPLYEAEVTQELYEYKCVCRSSFYVGETGDFKTLQELEQNGCNNCDYEGRFAFKSEIQLK